MKDGLNYSNLVSRLTERIPEFKGHDHLRENRIAYFTFFAEFLLINHSNDNLIKESMSFINDMADSQDEDLGLILDDLFLNIYSLAREKGIPIHKFVINLSDLALKRFNENVKLWSDGNLK